MAKAFAPAASWPVSTSRNPHAGSRRRWWRRGGLHPGSQISLASAGPFTSVPKNGDVPVSSENRLQLNVPGALRRYPVRPLVSVHATRFWTADAANDPAKASGASCAPETNAAVASVLLATWKLIGFAGINE